MFRERLSRLSEASLRINESLDFDDVLQSVLDSARALTGARFGTLTLFDDTGQIDDFLSSGLTPQEAQAMWDLPDALTLFEHFGNAARYSPEASPIRVKVAREGPHVLFSVADEGRGIRAERLPRLFRLVGVDVEMRSLMPALMAAARGGIHGLTERASTRAGCRVGKHQGGTMRGWRLTRRGDYINSEFANRTRAAVVSLKRSGLWAFVVRTLQVTCPQELVQLIC